MPKGVFPRKKKEHSIWRCPCAECRAKKKAYRQERNKIEWAKIRADPKLSEEKKKKSLEWRKSSSGVISTKKSASKAYRKIYAEASKKKKLYERRRAWEIANSERARIRYVERGYGKKYVLRHPEKRKASVEQYSKTHKRENELRFIAWMERGDNLEKYKGSRLMSIYDFLKLPPELQKARKLKTEVQRLLRSRNKSVPS